MDDDIKIAAVLWGVFAAGFFIIFFTCCLYFKCIALREVRIDGNENDSLRVFTSVTPTAEDFSFGSFTFTDDFTSEIDRRTASENYGNNVPNAIDCELLFSPSEVASESLTSTEPQEPHPKEDSSPSVVCCTFDEKNESWRYNSRQQLKAKHPNSSVPV